MKTHQTLNRATQLTPEHLESLFWAYFNNKMTVLLMAIEQPEIARHAFSRDKSKAFLRDLEHHFLPSEAKAKYRHAFKWLNRYLNHDPSASHRRIVTAIRMVNLIYEAFGVILPPRLEEKRMTSELLETAAHKREGEEKTFAPPAVSHDLFCLRDEGTVRRALGRSLKMIEEPISGYMDEELHGAKSSLYAAIERIGLRIQRLASIQRLFRELLGYVNASSAMRGSERQCIKDLVREIRLKLDTKSRE